jgi:hypothetical protein
VKQLRVSGVVVLPAIAFGAGSQSTGAGRLLADKVAIVPAADVEAHECPGRRARPDDPAHSGFAAIRAVFPVCGLRLPLDEDGLIPSHHPLPESVAQP